MGKHSKQIKKLIDEQIKVGDKVRLIDGSAVCCVEDADNEYYLIFAYPDKTGSTEILKDLEGTVIETGITDHVSLTLISDLLSVVYLQDIVVQIGDANFRTASQLVRKIDGEEKHRFASFVITKGDSAPKVWIGV